MSDAAGMLTLDAHSQLVAKERIDMVKNSKLQITNNNDQHSK